MGRVSSNRPVPIPAMRGRAHAGEPLRERTNELPRSPLFSPEQEKLFSAMEALYASNVENPVISSYENPSPSPRSTESPSSSTDEPDCRGDSAARGSSRAAGVALLTLLILATAVCAALVGALLFGAVPPSMPGLPLSIEPPCDAPPEPSTFLPHRLALPPPPSCRFTWSKLRCEPVFHCRGVLKWRPLPHPSCRLRDD